MWQENNAIGLIKKKKKETGYLFVWGCITDVCLHNQTFFKASSNFICLWKLWVNCGSKCLLETRSYSGASLYSHVAFQTNMKLQSNWGKSKSCSAAVLWAALCSIALETCLIGMCGPNSPHRLKLAGFMFTTIGFGIAALDCLCFCTVCMCLCVCVWQRESEPECKTSRVQR